MIPAGILGSWCSPGTQVPQRIHFRNSFDKAYTVPQQMQFSCACHVTPAQMTRVRKVGEKMDYQ